MASSQSLETINIFFISVSIVPVKRFVKTCEAYTKNRVRLRSCIVHFRSSHRVPFSNSPLNLVTSFPRLLKKVTNQIVRQKIWNLVWRLVPTHLFTKTILFVYFILCTASDLHFLLKIFELIYIIARKFAGLPGLLQAAASFKFSFSYCWRLLDRIIACRYVEDL